MKTTRYLTLAALLLGLVAVAPVRADVSKSELRDVFDEAYDYADRAYDLLEEVSSTYAEKLEEFKHPNAKAGHAMWDVYVALNSAGPLDRQKVASRAEEAVRFLGILADLADELEDQADDADDDRNEDLAEDIRRGYRRSKSRMRDLLKLVD